MQDGRTHRGRDLAGPWWSEAPRGARGRPSCKVLPAPETHGSSFSASSVPRWVTRGGGAPPGPSPRVPGRPDPHSPPRQGHLWWRVLPPTSLGSGKRTLYRARFPGLFPARGGLHLRRLRARIPPGWPGSGSAGIGKSPRALAPQRGRWEAGQRGEPRTPRRTRSWTRPFSSPPRLCGVCDPGPPPLCVPSLSSANSLHCLRYTLAVLRGSEGRPCSFDTTCKLGRLFHLCTHSHPLTEPQSPTVSQVQRHVSETHYLYLLLPLPKAVSTVTGVTDVRDLERGRGKRASPTVDPARIPPAPTSP